MIDYIIWRSKPGDSRVEESYCNELRESTELLAILNTLVSRRDEFIIASRINGLLNKRDRLVNVVSSICGEDINSLFINALDDPSNDELITEVLKKLHECMINHGCESNVSIEE